MIFLFNIFLSQLVGKWPGTFSASDGQEISLQIKMKKYQNNFTCFIRAKKHHKLLPKKAIFEEIEEGKSYNLFIPSKRTYEKIASFTFNSTLGNENSVASSTSEDGKYDITVKYQHHNQLQFFIFKKGKGKWYTLTLFIGTRARVFKPLTQIFKVVGIIGSVLFTVWIIIRLWKLQKPLKDKEKDE